MSNIEDIALYREIGTLRQGIAIVQQVNTKQLFIKKRLTTYNLDVFSSLVQHPIEGLPVIHDIFEIEDELVIIEEYISGDTLDIWIANGWITNETQVEDILLQLCHIVKRLHDSIPVIIHRDIKPSNIILTADGTVRLLDMNAAKYYNPSEEKDTTLLGTAGYAAPEQYGFGASNVGTDIYAIGILYRELINCIHHPSGKSDSIIDRCTKLDPQARYLTIHDLIRDISPENHANEEYFSRSFLPPGFRSNTPVHIIVATIGYLLLILTASTLKVTDGAIILNRICFFLIALADICISCNYLDIWTAFHLNVIRSPYKKAFIVICIDILFTLICLLILTIAESIR